MEENGIENYKGKLQEFCHKNDYNIPEYKSIFTSDLWHTICTIIPRCRYNDIIYSTQTSHNKTKIGSEQESAKNVLDIVNSEKSLTLYISDPSQGSRYLSSHRSGNYVSIYADDDDVHLHFEIARYIMRENFKSIEVYSYLEDSKTCEFLSKNAKQYDIKLSIVLKV